MPFTSIWKGGPSPAGGEHLTEEWPSVASLFHNRGLVLSLYLWKTSVTRSKGEDLSREQPAFRVRWSLAGFIWEFGKQPEVSLLHHANKKTSRVDTIAAHVASGSKKKNLKISASITEGLEINVCFSIRIPKGSTGFFSLIFFWWQKTTDMLSVTSTTTNNFTFPTLSGRFGNSDSQIFFRDREKLKRSCYNRKRLVQTQILQVWGRVPLCEPI